MGIFWRMARLDLIRPLLDGRNNLLLIIFLKSIRKRRVKNDFEKWSVFLRGLGPSFVKIGQSLSTRADLVGEEMAADLARLQDRMPPFPASISFTTIEGELGGTVDGLFLSFAEEPVAAASIAQVHFAVLPDGREVAVKILRPEIERMMERDLEFFAWIAKNIERFFPKYRRLRPVGAIKILRESVRIELDLRMEAAACSQLGENFRNESGYRVPQVIWSHTSQRVVTYSRVGGIRVDDRKKLLGEGIDLKQVMKNAATIFFNQVFRDGFFHADLHPGNLFVGDKGEIIAVDFGIVGRLDRKTRIFLAEMLLGFLTGDYDLVARVHFRAGYIPPDQNEGDFALACRAIGEPLLNRPMGEISLGKLLGQLFKVTEQFRMETQPQLLLLQKTMVIAEGVGRMLDPTTNMWLVTQPLIEKWMVQNRGPLARLEEQAKYFSNFIEDLEKGVRLHPETVDKIVRGIKNIKISNDSF